MKQTQLTPLAVALCLTALQCVDPPEDIVMPTWDVTLTVPVLHATYVLGSIIQLDSTLVDSLGNASKVTLTNMTGVLLDTSMVGDSTGDGLTDRWLDAATVEQITAATTFVEFQNGIPGTLRVKLAMLDAGGAVLFWVPTAPGDSLLVEAPTIVDGDVAAPRITRTPLELTTAEIRQLSRVVSVAYAIAAGTPVDQSVDLDLNDQVVMRSWAQMTYRVGQ
jgi:hypothetical protein